MINGLLVCWSRRLLRPQAKVSLFGDWANLDIVYTPQFDPDHFIDGSRLSYWNSNLSRLAGEDAVLHTGKPNRWFKDSEFVARLYKNINNYEFALYGYRGYWKSPGGENNAAFNKAFYESKSTMFTLHLLLPIGQGCSHAP